ncbi:phosphoserine phosphatase SerB [Telmatobacter sp. DSM 110680]|uniref:Phosphoserine phosphatase n=1 Tax=Telmatobacter sp. DSM 110680 TaxID=3036704 RepID=A0AAU7DL43_9BACT
MPSGSATKAVLIHFAGPDAPGLTAKITRILADYKVCILDIGQAVVHESLVLGILVEVPAGRESATLRSTVKTALSNEAHVLGLQAHFTTISEDRVKHWEHGLHHHHFIITILGRTITAEQLARVSAIIAAHGMNVDRIDRLSGELAPVDEQANACVELAVSGDPSREPPMRAEFLATAQELSIDIAFQRESIFRRNRRIFAFDMDSTLIQGEVIDELAKMAGVGDEVVRITESAMRGEIGFDESFTRRVALLKGLPSQRVHTLVDSIPLADGAERLIRTLRLLGYKTAILSGGFTFFARSLQQRLGIDYVHANELEISDGVVTGRVIPPIINGKRKAALLAEIAAEENVSLEQVVAVGDGANDIPMLNLAGMGIAYRAKPVVRQKADQSISCLGLDGLLYLLGVRDRDLKPHEPTITAV